MDNCCEGKTCTLNFLKHDWFQKGNDQIAINIYVKNVSDCSVDFQEDYIVIQFRTSNEQFLKIHGPKADDNVPVTFVYSISTSGKIIPDQCSFAVSNTRIDLKITKAVPNRWVSLEAKKAVIDRKKAFDVKRTSPDVNDSMPEKPRKSSTDKSVSESFNDVASHNKRAEVSGPSWASGSQYQNGFRSPENMALLGGKSTPVSKKSNDTEVKIEKEAVSEPQASAAPRDSNSLKNVNKAIITGLTGLENYANNCYMNVVIQVLANIPEIRDYFMDDHFLNSLSINNPLSSGGRVARAFSDVIKALWVGRKRPVKPCDLKNIMSKRCSSFLGMQQCDAQEFFCTLLENLHEDMNHGIRMDKSNESSHKESDGPSVNEKADTAWNEHSKRHDSLIIKMFHGQMVSKLTCLSCHKRSTTYEVCAQISLPIAMSMFRLPVTVFFRDHSRLPERLRLQISSPSAQIWHLLNVLERHIGVPAHCLRVCPDNKAPFGPAYSDDISLTSIQNLKQIIVCETKDERETDFVSLPFKQCVSNPSKLSTCPICSKSQKDMETKLKRCTKCMSVAYCSKECQGKHWPEHSRDCRKGFKSPVGLPFYVTISKHKLNFETLVADALHYANYSVGFIEKEAEHSDVEPEEKRPSKSEATSNVATKQPEKFSRMSSSSDADQDEKKQALKMEGALSAGSKNADNNNCKLRDVDKEERNRHMRMEGASNISTNLHDDFVIKAYVKADQDAILIYPDDFKLDFITSAEFLAIEWQKDCIKERDSKELNTPFKMVQGCHPDDQYGDRCSIGDCFSLFLEPEKLSEKDGWKCPKCKTVQAVKKEMALSYPPPILLVHFKRFTYGSYGEKVTKGINYPTSGLDLSHYITEETKNVLSSHPIYDLIGVICHKGTMGIGHYTCMVRCLNQQGQPDIGWRYFDDENVLKIDDERVCDSSAYVLVYRMRGTVQALKTECPFVVSPLQTSEGCQERSRAAARAPVRQLSTDNDSDTGSKLQFFDNGIAKGDARQSERKRDSDQKEEHVDVQGPNVLFNDKSRLGLSEEDFPEDKFEMANDSEFVFPELSKQQCTRENEEVENIKEVGSGKRHSTFDSNRNAGVETATVDTVGGNYYEELTRDLLVEDVASKGNGIPRVHGPLGNQSSTEEPVQSTSTAKESEEDEEEYFFLAQSNVEPVDIAEVTEDDLD